MDRDYTIWEVMIMVKWGVLGTASIARGCTIPGMQKAENCELTAIAGRSLEKAEAFKSEFGFKKAYGSYEALLEDPEIQAVYIPLPNNLHYEWCMKAIKAGKNVLCEKPLAPSKKEAEELFAAAKEANVTLMEAFAYLHTPYIEALKNEIASGTIGEVRYIESAFMVQSCDPSNIRMFRKNYGGAMYDLGCYCISFMVWLLGEVPVKARGLGEFTDDNIDIYSSAYFNFPGGARGSLNCGMIFGREHDCRMDRHYIRGSKGTIISSVEYNQEGELSYTVNVDGQQPEVKTFTCKHNYQLEVEQLGRCITDGESAHVSPEFSIMSAEAMDMALTAIGYN